MLTFNYSLSNDYITKVLAKLLKWIVTLKLIKI